jgi:ATP-binding cassette subfamily C (CFTR/MRP) protein 1
MTPLMKKGASQFITEDDLPSLTPGDESGELGKDLDKALVKQSVNWLS